VRVDEIIIWISGLMLVIIGPAVWVGWSLRTWLEERRTCAWCSDRTETSKALYCRRHGAEVREKMIRDDPW